MSLTSYPSISIIIPSFNQGKFIERTLLSIFNQDYEGNVQVIVSDGGSKDETIDLLKKYSDKINWWSAPDKGFVDAVMKGLEKATGELIGIQSSDDYYTKDAFKKIVNGFNDNPSASFIAGGEIRIDLDYNIREFNLESGAIDIRRTLFGHQPQQHATFIKREFIDKVGGLRQEVDMVADLDLWFRILHFSKGVYIPDYIGVYQLHPEQRTQTSNKWYNSLVRMVETCENDSFYNSKFALKPKEKEKLYYFWDIYWSAAIGDVERARMLALEKIDSIQIFDDRTQLYINQYYYNSPLLLKSKRSLLSRCRNKVMRYGKSFSKTINKQNNVTITPPTNQDILWCVTH